MKIYFHTSEKFWFITKNFKLSIIYIIYIITATFEVYN